MSKRERVIGVFLAASLIILLPRTPSYAQSPVVTMTLGPNDIGTIQTGLGITTRISFGEPVKLVICGDLHDPLTGKGKFLVQSLENEVYIKPVSGEGTSNIFVKVGGKKNANQIYNFDLLIVPVEQANRVINVISAATLAAAANKKAEFEDVKTNKARSEPPVLERSKAKAKTEGAGNSGDTATKDQSAKRLLAMYPPTDFQPLKTGTEMVIANSEKIIPVKDVDEGEPIKQVYPDYPELARLLQITGPVNVAISINKQGNVTNARAVSGPHILRDAAIAAAREWKFSKTKVGGRPVEGSRVLTFNFRLARSANAANQGEPAPQADKDQELKTALEMVQKSLAVDPKNTLLLSSAGWIYFHLGQLEEAERYLNMAADREPKNSEVQERFGDVCFSLGKKAEAEQAWRKAINMADDAEQKNRVTAKLVLVNQ